MPACSLLGCDSSPHLSEEARVWVLQCLSDLWLVHVPFHIKIMLGIKALRGCVECMQRLEWGLEQNLQLQQETLWPVSESRTDRSRPPDWNLRVSRGVSPRCSVWEGRLCMGSLELLGQTGNLPFLTLTVPAKGEKSGGGPG